RLVVLNACQTATADTIDVFRGVAQALVRAGLPAVIANQFNVYDDSALAFAREFYRALADDYPVDAAVTEGRKGVMASLAGLKKDWRGEVDWATPTLFLRAPDGVLWDIAVPAPQPVVSAAPVRIQEAYLLWTTLAFFPAFLESPAALRPPLTALAQADPATLRERDRETWYLYDPEAEGAQRFIPGLGRIVAGDARGWPLPLAPHLSQRGHVPYLIDPHWQVQWVGPARVLGNVYTESSVHVHLFPTGMVSILTGVRLRDPAGMTTERLVELVSRVRPSRPHAQFLVGHRGQEESVDEVGLTRRVRETLSQGLFGQPRQHRRLRRPLSDWGLLYVYVTDPPLARPEHTQEMARLATLELADLDVTVVTACSRTDRALFAGDWVLVENEHESVAYTPAMTRRDNRRRFLWQLAAVIEFAYIEAALCDYFIGARAGTAELRDLLQDLALFHLDIPDRYQTVYRRLATLLRTEERRHQISTT
ncbi:MAG: CHAT domain-containing protein, partial [Chloroflexi bacterium]|nr:CHAT domain-containing protein [Chloroflexota bacterium]